LNNTPSLVISEIYRKFQIKHPVRILVQILLPLAAYFQHIALESMSQSAKADRSSCLLIHLFLFAYVGTENPDMILPKSPNNSSKSPKNTVRNCFWKRTISYEYTQPRNIRMKGPKGQNLSIVITTQNVLVLSHFVNKSLVHVLIKILYNSEKWN
jgi:hypothetical protein